MKTGMDLLAQNKPIDARKMLTAALDSPGISPTDAEKIRAELTKLNQRLVFGPDCVPGDPFVQAYSLESGDTLVRLPKKLGLSVDHLFLKRINNIQDAGRLQVGQRIKLVKGPFQAVVYKREFRLDLYMGESEDRVYVRSFRVGLGAQDSTPEGTYAVKANSKLINPAWTNPRTHERFEPNDPKNPLGEFWIGLIGVSDNIRDLEGYGIHGTIDPDSIGQQKSMGCIRMAADDIALVYELLMDNVSHVEVHGEDYP